MWSSIKNILKDGRTRCVVIEDGKPLYVVLPFDEYQQLQGNEKGGIVRENFKEDEINGEIQGLNAESPEEEPVTSSIKIEDLPF